MALYDKASLVLIPSGTKAGTVFSQKPVPSNDVLGDELVTNGTFDTDSDWDKGTGWTIANGVATATSTSATFQQLSINLIEGKTYKVSFEIKSYTSGTLNVDLGSSSSSANFTDDGIKIVYLESAGFNRLRFYGGNVSCSIDNVSVRRVVDGDFDFTRSSYATRVNSQGLIEKERGNVWLQSTALGTSPNATTSQANITGGQSGYDGSSDAWELESLSDGFYRRLYQGVTQTGVITFSIYAKASATNFLLIYNSQNGHRAWFDLSSGSLGTLDGAIDSSIEDIGSDWYRCSISLNTTVSSEFWICPANGDNVASCDLGNSILLQDAQLEQGLVATDVIETTTAAVYEGITDNVPRLDYDGDCPSLLLEPQRQNLVTDSEYFESSFWQLGTNSTLSFVSDLNPSGTQGCYRLQNPASSSTYLASGSLGVINNDSVFSVYVKSNTGSNQDFGLYYISGSATTITFTATTEWQRFQINPTSGFYQVGINNESDAYSNDILVYGAQLEEGSYATSYIPTYGTSVTRNEDFCDNAGDSTIFNNQEGVLYAEIAALNDDLTFRVIGLSDDTNSNIVKFGYRADSNAIYFEARDGNVSQAFQIAYVSDITQFHKVAIKFKENDFAMWIDGSEVKTDNLGTVPSGMTMINFDGGNGFANFLGKVKSLAYFNRALTDQELADLTT